MRLKLPSSDTIVDAVRYPANGELECAGTLAAALLKAGAKELAEPVAPPAPVAPPPEVAQ